MEVLVKPKAEDGSALVSCALMTYKSRRIQYGHLDSAHDGLTNLGLRHSAFSYWMPFVELMPTRWLALCQKTSIVESYGTFGLEHWGRVAYTPWTSTAALRICLPSRMRMR